MSVVRPALSSVHSCEAIVQGMVERARIDARRMKGPFFPGSSILECEQHISPSHRLSAIATPHGNRHLATVLGWTEFRTLGWQGLYNSLGCDDQIGSITGFSMYKCDLR